MLRAELPVQTKRTLNGRTDIFGSQRFGCRRCGLPTLRWWNCLARHAGCPCRRAKLGAVTKLQYFSPLASIACRSDAELQDSFILFQRFRKAAGGGAVRGPDHHAVPTDAAFPLEPVAEVRDAEIMPLDRFPELTLAHRGLALKANAEMIVSLRGHARLDPPEQREDAERQQHRQREREIE